MIHFIVVLLASMVFGLCGLVAMCAPEEAGPVQVALLGAALVVSAILNYVYAINE